MSYLPRARAQAVIAEQIGGLTGNSWRLRGVDFDILARNASKEKVQLGVDIRREFRVLCYLWRFSGGLAQRPLAIIHGWLFVEWLPGVILNNVRWQQVLADGSLAAKLAKLHQLRHCCGYTLDLKASFIRYWQHIDPARKTPTLLKLQRFFLQRSQPTALRKALLHMDVHCANLLISDSDVLMLIDWEYAGNGDIALELALLFYELNSPTKEKFITAYLQNMPGLSYYCLRSSITAWEPWVSYLRLMWYETRWYQTGNCSFLNLAAPLRQYFCLDK